MTARFMTLSRLFGLTSYGPDDHRVLVDESLPGSIDLANFRRLCRQVRTVLDKLGIQPAGRPVHYAAVLPNEAITPCIFLGIADASSVACLLSPKLGTHDTDFAMKDMEVNALIRTNRDVDNAQRTAKEMKIPTIEMHLEPSADGFKIEAAVQEYDSDTWRRIEYDESGYSADRSPNGTDCILKLHTSGTTGKPKTVPISHANATASCLNQIRTYEWTREDKGLLVMPLFHVHGLFNGCLAPLAANACIIIPASKSFHKKEFWDAAGKHKPTFVTAVPSIWQILVNDTREHPELAGKLSGLRYARGCSSGLPPPLAEQIEKVFTTTVVEAYAMTEASHQMCSNDLRDREFGSVGFPQGIEVAIIDNGKVQGFDEKGEICVRGPNVITAYHGLSPEDNAKNFYESADVMQASASAARAFATSCAPLSFSGSENPEEQFDKYVQCHRSHFMQRVVGDLESSRVPELRWLRTGDQGLMKSTGRVCITGRIKELINRGGEKIAPAEIESIILKMDSVTEVAAFGMPDEVLGEVVAVAVCLKDRSRSETVAGDIRQWCKKSLAAFKTPQRIYVCDSDALPKGPTGKVQRVELRKLYGTAPYL